jgi:hypothetical protein
MTHVFTENGRRYRFRALALLAVLVGACNGTDSLTSNDPPEVAPDSTAASSPAADPSVDSLGQLTPAALSAEVALYSSSGMAFGPEGLWATYYSLKTNSLPFNGSSNYTDARGIITQINAARNMRHRLVLNMTGGSHSRYKTNGRFDLSKWKAVMNTYNRSDIKAAVAKGVADGTIIMNSVMDEPNVKDWGGVVTKSMLDGMARYVKNIFPTLVVGVQLRWDWRTTEKFRVMDAYITAYKASRGTPSEFRTKVLNNARAQGMKVMFALNVLDGGFSIRGCPLTKTGGYGTYYPNCRMTASQVSSWGRYLGPAGCAALTMWEYDRAFMTKSANVTAFRAVASTLRGTPARSCRRG